jgi:exodeoxyribonuclease VII large subunit
MARQALSQGAQQGAFALMMDAIGRRQQQLDDLRFRLETAERRLMEQHRRRWERASGAVRHYDARRILAGVGRDLQARTAAMSAAINTALLRHRSRLEQIERQLRALSPIAILDRGYALIFDGSGKLVKSSAQVEAGSEITARLAKGTVTARVEKKS